jgi:outer membrane protein OmpA-like peptidoglycan-associated protein
MLFIFRNFKIISFTAICIIFFLSTSSWAQNVLSTADMVEQLKAQPARTRGLRNMTLEVVTVEPVKTTEQTATPSLSLLIQFDFNSARVKPESQQALANLADALQSKELLEAKFSIEGHTDAKGRADYNLKLSQLRADSVRTQLTNHGVVSSRLLSIGKGSMDLANTSDPQAAENRRVRIVNLNSAN